MELMWIGSDTEPVALVGPPATSGGRRKNPTLSLRPVAKPPLTHGPLITNRPSPLAKRACASESLTLLKEFSKYPAFAHCWSLAAALRTAGVSNVEPLRPKTQLRRAAGDE